MVRNLLQFLWIFLFGYIFIQPAHSWTCIQCTAFNTSNCGTYTTCISPSGFCVTETRYYTTNVMTYETNKGCAEHTPPSVLSPCIWTNRSKSLNVASEMRCYCSDKPNCNLSPKLINNFVSIATCLVASFFAWKLV